MKNHYRYFQRREESAWIPIADDHAEVEARAQGAVRLSILSTSIILGYDSVATKDTRYYGPLYFDIDNKEDLAMALESANRLVKLLVEEYLVEERDLSIYLSGTKGVHVLIDPETFGLSRSVVRLPEVYKEMARKLYVQGLDLAPYSARNAFRLTDVRREDGNYRVQVSALELRDMTVIRYRELCSGPRGFRPPRKSGQLNTQLHLLFEQATDTVKKLERGAFTDSSGVESPVLRQHFSKEPPACMEQLASGAKHDEAGFNQVAVQVAIFAARLDADGMGSFRPVYERVADNQRSSQYNTPRLRREHMDGQYQYMKHTPKYRFSCSAVRAVLKSRSCCDDCPIQAAKLIESPADAAKSMGVTVRADGYYDTTGKNPRRISTFILEPRHTYVQVQENGTQMRIGTSADVTVNGMNVGCVTLNDAAWDNRNSFLRCIRGMSNLGFFGNDNDLQKIKHMALSDPDLPQKTATWEMGMHITRVAGKEVRTYVEQSGSINNLKMQNTYAFEGFDVYRPFLLTGGLSAAKAGDEKVTQVLKDLLSMNTREVMGLLIGWTVACHLKEHLMQLTQQFPLVNLWGNMGSGKSTLARFACVLGGVDLLNQHREMNVAVSTPFAWLTSLSNSRTHPVMWDELNRNGRMTNELYGKAMEFLKAAFNAQSVQKGSVNRETSSTATGPTVKTYATSRPVIYCSEQEPDVPAVLERTISIMVTKNELTSHLGFDRRCAANLQSLKEMAYTLMLNALATPTTAVKEMLDPCLEEMPEGIKPRVAYGLAISLLGLNWLEKLLITRGLMDIELQTLVNECRTAVRGRVAEVEKETADMQISSEVDNVFSAIFDILHLAAQVQAGVPGVRAPLQYLQHFCFAAGGGKHFLYLDLRAAHAAYLEWSRHKGARVALDNVKVFATLAKQEDYVLGVIREPEILQGRYVIHIDLERAALRGLPTYYAEEFLKPAVSRVQKSAIKDDNF